MTPPTRKRTDEVTYEERAHMLQLHEDGLSYREISQILNRSTATISRYLQRMGADTQRAQTAEATAARMRKMQERRMDLAEKLLGDAESLRDRVWSEYVIVAQSPEGPVQTLLDEPPLREQADGYKAIASAINTVDTLLDGTGNDGAAEAKNVLTNIFEGLAKMVNPTTGADERDNDHDYDIRLDPNEQPADTPVLDDEDDLEDDFKDDDEGEDEQ